MAAAGSSGSSASHGFRGWWPSAPAARLGMVRHGSVVSAGWAGSQHDAGMASRTPQCNGRLSSYVTADATSDAQLSPSLGSSPTFSRSESASPSRSRSRSPTLRMGGATDRTRSPDHRTHELREEETVQLEHSRILSEYYRNWHNARTEHQPPQVSDWASPLGHRYRHVVEARTPERSGFSGLDRSGGGLALTLSDSAVLPISPPRALRQRREPSLPTVNERGPSWATCAARAASAPPRVRPPTDRPPTDRGSRPPTDRGSRPAVVRRWAADGGDKKVVQAAVNFRQGAVGHRSVGGTDRSGQWDRPAGQPSCRWTNTALLAGNARELEQRHEWQARVRGQVQSRTHRL